MGPALRKVQAGLLLGVRTLMELPPMWRGDVGIKLSGHSVSDAVEFTPAH